MREVLLQEGFLEPKAIDLIIKENCAQRFKWLPSEIDKQDINEIMAIMYINKLRRKDNSDEVL